MPGRIPLFLVRLGRAVWVRAAAYTTIAIVVALAAGVIGAALPFTLTMELGQNSVDEILQIIASSMLAVTTFSLTAMVTAYSSATTTATPRATQLLVQDRTAQNALSTFIGGFAFSLVGIIALATGYYGEQGRTILFLGTLAMIAVIIITLLRWISHLTRFGRMADVIDRVEDAATAALCAYAAAPALGGRPWSGDSPGAYLVTSEQTGYVTHIDVGALQRLADEQDVTIAVLAMPGRIADPTSALVRTTASVPDGATAVIRRAFTIGAHRDFDQDPRLGVIALAEIGSRALSPSTNDPGTAIEVIAALQRVFTKALSAPSDNDVIYSRVLVEPVALDDLLTDAFRPLARDGSGIIEVQVRLQKCLTALARTVPHQEPSFGRASHDALSRARAALPEIDLRELLDVVGDASNTAPTDLEGPTT